MAQAGKVAPGRRVRFRVLGLVPAPGPSGANLLLLTIGRLDGAPEQTFGVRAAALAPHREAVAAAVAAGAVHWVDFGHQGGNWPRGAGSTVERLLAAVTARQTVPPDPDPDPFAPSGR